MSLAKLLVEQPLREKGGPTAQERFDYQALWGLALIFSNHESGEDYAIAFEFHDDVLLLDNSTDPASVHFYQVKTKNSGHWTMTELFHRKPAKKGSTKPHSHLGKLFQDFLTFPSHTTGMGFVSNVPLEFGSQTAAEQAFSDCGDDDFEKFMKKLKAEHPSATDTQAALMHFVRADLSLQDADTHTKGKLHNFVVQSLGDITYSLDTFFRAVVEDCRTRSKYTGDIGSFEDLIRLKAITRADVEVWLHQLETHANMPEWAEISSELDIPALVKSRMRQEWLAYRSKVLDAGDEGVRTARRRIRRSLEAASEDLSMNELLEAVFAEASADVRAAISPLSDERLRVMILYEVYRHGAPGEFQALGPQSSDPAV